MAKCYMCDAAGVTKEHVPPRSFFAKPRPKLMVTVPSCKRHNLDNSKDVEYVRNLIVLMDGINDVGRAMSPTVHRSLAKSPKLRLRILRAAKPIVWRGQPTGLVSAETPRFKNVMRAIAHAVHFKDFARTYGHHWDIYHATMLSRLEQDGRYDAVNPQIRAALRSVPVPDRDTFHPDVFKFAVYQVDEQRIIYKFQFYEGFIVFAIGMLNDGEPDT